MLITIQVTPELCNRFNMSGRKAIHSPFHRALDAHFPPEAEVIHGKNSIYVTAFGMKRSYHISQRGVEWEERLMQKHYAYPIQIELTPNDTSDGHVLLFPRH